MTIDPRLTVSEIVKRHPEVGSVLARFGLDTCCGGMHPLEHACRAHKINLNEVLDALEAALAASGEAVPEGPIHSRMNLRAILAAYPAAADVLARHGLMGCGGREGPDERLDWFARVHGVPLPPLLEELNAAVSGAGAAMDVPHDAAAAPAVSPQDLAREN